MVRQWYAHSRMVVSMVKTPRWRPDALRTLVDRVLKETGMSQAQLAALVPMDQSALSKWRSGTSKPKYEGLVSLGAALRDQFPQLGLGPDDVAATVYPRTADAPVAEPTAAPVSDAELAGITAVDMIRAAVRAELEPLREKARSQEEAIALLTEEVRALRQQNADRNGTTG